MTFERSASWAFLRSGLSNQLTQSSLCPSNSPWLNGCSRAVMARPAKESWAPGSLSRFAEPVSTKRPGRRSLSTTALSERMSSGQRWISSITRRPSLAELRKPAGSSWANVRVRSSSMVVNVVLALSIMPVNVDLPTCRAPSMTTIGEMSSNSCTQAVMLRCNSCMLRQ